MQNLAPGLRHRTRVLYSILQSTVPHTMHIHKHLSKFPKWTWPPVAENGKNLQPSKITPAKGPKQCEEGDQMVRWYGKSRHASETGQRRKTCFLVAREKCTVVDQWHKTGIRAAGLWQDFIRIFTTSSHKDLLVKIFIHHGPPSLHHETLSRPSFKKMQRSHKISFLGSHGENQRRKESDPTRTKCREGCASTC